jgi:predicted RNase H-like nuclease (RuvC/YqgF family)
LKKLKPSDKDIDGRLNEMLGIIQDLRDKLEKERQDRHEELEIEREARDKDVKSLRTQLDEERANRKEDVEALRRVSPHVRGRPPSS